MFLYNLRYKWGIQKKVALPGVVFNASGKDSYSMRSSLPLDDYDGLSLFDPQIYLSGLELSKSEKTWSRLASYPFFPFDVPEFRDCGLSKKAWMRQLIESVRIQWPASLPIDDIPIREMIRSAINFQVELGVSRIILPVPLISEIDTPLEQTMRWVDIGHKEFLALLDRTGNNYPLPLITLAISERLIQNQPPAENNFLQGIIDHVSSREEISGIYLVIEKNTNISGRITNPYAAWSLFHMAHVFGVLCGKDVFVNFAEQLGLFALAAGAKGFASGYETKTRRCCLSDYVERGGGQALPKFYSLSTLCEYLPKRDLLDKIVPARLMHIFNSDKQPASKDLFLALNKNIVPGNWRETRQNVLAANIHFIQRITGAVNELNSLTNQNEKIDLALNWLQIAERNNNYLSLRFQDRPLSDQGIHIEAWRQAFENYIDEFK